MYLPLILSICLFLGNSDLCKGLYNNTQKKITLNTKNVLLLKGEINEKLATQFVYELNQKQSKKGIYVYLDTNGGSVDAGNKIVEEIFYIQPEELKQDFVFFHLISNLSKI